LSIVRETDSSLPGIGLALTITVSPGWISTKRWSRLAMRASPAIGSPCAPVVAMTSLGSGWSLILSLGTMREGSYVRYPRSVAIRKFCSIERPMTETLRFMSAAASRTCCTRAMLLAKVATITRPSSGSMISRKASPTVRSEGV
jgi:hypothetical protein